MRFTTLPLVAALLSLTAACTPDVGGTRKPARGTAPTQDTGPCTKLEQDVVISLDPLGLSDPKLEEVDGDIAITGNTALTAVPLGNLTRLTGALTVSGNPALTSIDLGKLATTGPIEIADNARLGSLSTMSALYRVTGSVMINSNPALANLAAFTTSLRFIDQSLTITNNAQLTDLGALKHLSLVGAITITGNQNLVNCRALEVDRCTQHPTASVITNNKTTSCTAACVD